MSVRITFINSDHRISPIAGRPQQGSDLPPRDRSSGRCILVGAMLLIVSFSQLFFKDILHYCITAEMPIKFLREPQNEIAIRSPVSRSERAPSAE